MSQVKENLNSDVKLKKSSLKLITIFFLLYCLISSGAYGLEEMVSAAGPGMALLLLVLIPIFWGAPFGLIVAELSSIYPQEGGIYVWVRNTFGEFWGYCCGWWYTIMGFIDTAVYLVLAILYIEAFIDLSPPARIALIVGLAIIFAYINIKGIEVVGTSTVVLGIIILIPFIVLTIMGFAQWQHNPVMPFFNSEEGFSGSFGLALIIGLWLYSGYEAISTLNGEIEHAEKVVPKGLMIIMPFVALAYILPTVASLAAVGRWDEWATDGGLSFIELGQIVGGKPLMIIFVIGALFSNLAIYNDYIASSSRVPFVMAEDNLFPKSFVKLHKKLRTPYISILAITLVTAVLASIGSFEGLLTIDVFLYLFCLIFMFMAAVKLRIKHPEMKRPYKVPVGTKAFTVLALIPTAIAIFSLFSNGIGVIIGGVAGIISGPLTYYLFKEMYGGIGKKDFCSTVSVQTKCCSYLIPIYGVIMYLQFKKSDLAASKSLRKLMSTGFIVWILAAVLIYWGVKGNLLELLLEE